MEEGEAKIRQEDCNEDNLGQGVLTLTNKRVAFDKTRGRIMDFAKKFGDTVLDVQLDKITKVGKKDLSSKKYASLQIQQTVKRRSNLVYWEQVHQINTKRKRYQVLI